MDATRPSLARHLGSGLLAIAMLVALATRWADRAPQRTDPTVELVRTQIQLIQMQRELVEMEIRIDEAIRNLEVVQPTGHRARPRFEQCGTI